MFSLHTPLPFLFIIVISLATYGQMVAAQMTCPPGYATEYSITLSDYRFFVRCCNTTSPGGRACAGAYVFPDTPGDYRAFCDDLFPQCGCDCGRLCTGTAQYTPTVATCTGGNCLCTTIYCCHDGVPCNYSSPSAHSSFPPLPTRTPTPKPSHAPSRAPVSPSNNVTGSPTSAASQWAQPSLVVVVVMSLFFAIICV